MKKAKLLTVSLALVLFCSVFTACTGTSGPAAGAPSSGGSTSAPPPQESSGGADYPTKSIRVIVPYAAGGNTDLNARAVASIMQENKILSQPMVVSNITGANTMDACSAILDADPDGYTLLCHHSSLLAINASGAGRIRYDDMEPVIEVASAPFCIVASKSSGFKTVEEVVEYAKANPGKLKMAYIGAGSTTHLTAMLFLTKAGIADYVNVVSYSNGADGLTAQLSGEVELRASVGPDAARYITSGDLIPLCVSSAASGGVWAGIPTWEELGYGIEFSMSQGFYTTKGTPAESIEILADAVEEVCKTDAYADFCKENGMTPTWTRTGEWKTKLDAIYQICEGAFSSGILS